MDKNHYNIRELSFFNGASKYNDADGCMEFVYKNGILMVCGLIKISATTTDKLCKIPIPPTKQHWTTLTSSVGEKSYGCRLDTSGYIYPWEDQIVPGTYIIDTTF